MRRKLVLGGGLAGLAAAAHLPDAELHEAHEYLAGHCRTKWVDGFGFDEGAHVFFGKGEDAERFVLEPMGEELQQREAEIWNCYGPGEFGRYPVQLNAHALDPGLATRCVAGFVKATYAPQASPPERYDAWCRMAFGDDFAENFFFRYARKVWTVDPSELTVDWLGSSAGARIQRPALDAVLRGAIDPEPQPGNYFQTFSYPRLGGFDRIAAPLRRLIDPGRIHLGSAVVGFNAGRREMRFSDGTTRAFDAAVSTVPLPTLVKLTDDAPASVRQAASQLRWTSNRFVNFGIARPDVGPGDWCYFYPEDVPFFRTSVPSRFSPANAPAGHSALTCEIAHAPWKPLVEDGLVERVSEALFTCGVLRRDDRIVLVDQVEAPYGYVIFDEARPAALATIHAWMREHGVEPAGRFGEWGYHWSFEAIGSGRRAAMRVRGESA